MIIPFTVAAVCSLHPEAVSVGTCLRCGRFVCAACRGTRDECPACEAAATARRRDQSIATLQRERWIAQLVVGAGILVTAGGLVASAAAGMDPEASLLEHIALGAVTGLLFGVPLWVAALLTASVRRWWMPWVTLALELAGLWMWVQLMRSETRVGLFAFPIGFFSFSRTVVLHRLMRPRPKRPAVATE